MHTTHHDRMPCQSLAPMPTRALARGAAPACMGARACPFRGWVLHFESNLPRAPDSPVRVVQFEVPITLLEESG